jgi:hypothetical protein
MADKTKTVSGKELSASDFAYVGDPNDTSTWSLPVHDKDHVQNALVRFNQTDLPADKKDAVARKLVSKAKAAGIDASGFEKEHVKSSAHADFGNGWVEIFRAGSYGEKGSFSDADLDRVIANYDPSNHEAPACIGHPKDDMPAYGWADRLMRDGGTLLAKFKEVDPAFESAVKAGKFKKRSAAFYLDGDGKISGLRHVAFLGAQPPEVKGLKNLNFNDDEGRRFTSVDFGEEEVVEKSVKDQIKEFFAEMFRSGSGEPRTFSESDAQALVTRAVEAATKPLTEQVTQLKADLQSQTAKFNERETALAGGEIRQRATAAVARLKGAGKWIPAFEKQGLPLVFDELAKVTTTIEFGEGDAKKKITPLETLVLFLEGLPRIVPDGRVFGGGARPSAQSTGTGDPLTDMARTLQREKKITFAEALTQVAEEHPELTVPGGARAGAV